MSPWISQIYLLAELLFPVAHHVPAWPYHFQSYQDWYERGGKLDSVLQQMASSILSPRLNQGSRAVVWGISAAGLASSQTAWTRTNCFSHLCPWKCPCFVCKRRAREILPQLGSHPNRADGIMSLCLHSYSRPPLDSALLSFNHRPQSCVLQQIHLTQLDPFIELYVDTLSNSSEA